MSGAPPRRVGLFPAMDAEGAAVFSPCRLWRYRLRRVWLPEAGVLNIVGLNPSTADETTDDPTIRRCIDFAQRLGHGGLEMTNLFAYRATGPRDLRDAAGAGLDVIGPDTDATLVAVAQGSAAIIAAWGVHGRFLSRDQEVLSLLRRAGVPVLCLGETQAGFPRHPLYLAKTTRPQIYQETAI